MKHYIKTIKWIQDILLGTGILTLTILPLVIAYNPDVISSYTNALYDVAHITVFFVMLIRPLADIFPGIPFIRPLVILRKGFGVLSASIVVSFLLAKILIDPMGYVIEFINPTYWSLAHYALLAHLADITAVLLLVTSNSFSKRMLGPWWKRIQRLSYVYFYASAFYVFATFGTISVFFYMIIITIVTITAFFANTLKRSEANQVNPQTV